MNWILALHESCVLQYFAVYSSLLQRDAVCYSVLQRVAVCCSVLQRVEGDTVRANCSHHPSYLLSIIVSEIGLDFDTDTNTHTHTHAHVQQLFPCTPPEPSQQHCRTLQHPATP